VESWRISLWDSPSWFDFLPQNMAENVDGHLRLAKKFRTFFCENMCGFQSIDSSPTFWLPQTEAALAQVDAR
jgi:hypothetical protein